MKYQELLNGVRCFERDFWFGDVVYLSTLNELKDIQEDVSTLTLEIVREVVKVYLQQWGQMSRQINQPDTDWLGLKDSLIRNADKLNAIHDLNFLELNSSKLKTIIEIYHGIFVKRIGDTGASKVLHLLNPKLFVMWDTPIRAKLSQERKVRGYKGYLQLCMSEVRDAMKEVGLDNENEFVYLISKDLQMDESLNRRVAELCRKKTLAKLIDEYWWQWANR